MARRWNRIFGIALLGGSAAVALGAILDWTGVGYSSSADRWISIGAAVLAAVIGGIVLSGRPRVALAATVPALVALDMAVVNIQDVSGHHYEYIAYPSARVGVGLYLLLAGGLTFTAVAVGALVITIQARRGRQSVGGGSL